jgi:putative hydrolase of the HAD superfamily
MPSTVLFDLDDTICAYNRGVEEVLSVSFERAGVEPFFDAADWAAVVPEVSEADSQRHFRELTFGMLAERRGRDPEHARAVAAAYGAERDHSDVRFLPGASEALDRLSGSHRLGLVTNGAPEMQEPKLDALGLRETFEEVVYAGSETLAKPHPSPFERILSRLGESAGGSVHVGNSLGSDVAGAKAAGLGAVWVPQEGDFGDEGGDHEPDYHLDTLHDIHSVPGLDV